MSTAIDQQPAAEALYERDFYAWAMTNARLLRQGQLAGIDAEHIAEELETMGRSERRELIHRLAVLLAHLLKWRLQPALRGKSWRATIREQRRQAGRLLKDSPSLRHGLEGNLLDAYQDALLLVLKETPLEESELPTVCPFALEQVLDDGYWPE